MKLSGTIKYRSRLLSQQKRCIFTFPVLHKQIPNNLKGRSKSSQEWLSRQLTDPYIEKAKMANYRCRSAFKLLEIDDKYHLLSAGQTVVDCGAAPGSWTQVLVERTNSAGSCRGSPVGKVIGIDRLPIYPIAGAILLGNTDFTLPCSQVKLKEHIGEQGVNVVLSDMAPNASGVRSLDQENIIHLAYTAFRFSVQVLSKGGSFLVKVWDGGEVPTLEKDLAKFYSKVRSIKPPASRVNSAEKFILARGFKGLK
ncbi:rRNA methyltransferase 2, mitochondrial [Anabrus simplex]|uniref:rRNA methyltransferase 2, mitochondrial n=1 Tax=Anabrus simplex TaxID=316456 RepID=UPI0035A3AE35